MPVGHKETFMSRKFVHNCQIIIHIIVHNSNLFDEFVAQFTHERVEYNVFLFDELLKGSKSLKTFKITLTFRFDKL
jgi:hypothetical protein